MWCVCVDREGSKSHMYYSSAQQKRRTDLLKSMFRKPRGWSLVVHPNIIRGRCTEGNTEPTSFSRTRSETQFDNIQRRTCVQHSPMKTTTNQINVSRVRGLSCDEFRLWRKIPNSGISYDFRAGTVGPSTETRKQPVVPNIDNFLDRTHFHLAYAMTVQGSLSSLPDALLACGLQCWLMWWRTILPKTLRSTRRCQKNIHHDRDGANATRETHLVVGVPLRQTCGLGTCSQHRRRVSARSRRTLVDTGTKPIAQHVSIQ